MIIPEYLEKDFRIYDHRIVDINSLNVGLHLMSGQVKYVSVIDTPHYMFVRNILKGDGVQIVHGYKNYAQYISLYSPSASINRFIKLIESIQVNGYDSKNKPILVFRNWRRPWPINRWDVADGYHRLAVLAALGERFIKVGTLQYKKNMAERLRGRFGKEPD